MEENWTSVLRLVGFVEATKLAINPSIGPAYERRHEQLLSLMRNRFAPEELERGLAVGASLTRAEAVTLAVAAASAGLDAVAG